MALQIVRHAILMVFNNWRDALKASLGPIVLGIAVSLVLAVILQVDLSLIVAQQPIITDTGGPMAQQLPPNAGGLILFGLLAALISLFVLSWVAVAWHRFILLEEYPGTIPTLTGKPVWPYLGKSVWLALVLIVVFVPISLVFGLALGPVAVASPFLAGVIAAILLGLVFGYLWLRWALVLPSAAVGEGMSLSDSWATTRPLSGTIWSVSILVILLNFVLGLIAAPFGQSFIALIVQQVVNWFTLMVGLSVLTTLYGHLVEKRPLVD